MHHNMSYPSITTHRSECLFLRRVGPRFIGRYAPHTFCDALAPIHHKKCLPDNQIFWCIVSPTTKEMSESHSSSEQQNHLTHCISAK